MRCASNFVLHWIVSKIAAYKREKKLLKLAEEVLRDNPNTCLTGTLMLRLRGIDLGRPPKDIDILICDYAPTIKLDEKWKEIPDSKSSNGIGIKYEYDGIILDVMSSNEQPEYLNGIRLGSVEKLVEKKIRYSKQENDQAEKHKKDLDILKNFDLKPY